MIVNCLCPTFI